VGDLVVPTDRGLYCSAGGFYIDPWKPVEKAIITHGHGDHLRAGSTSYLTAERGIDVVRARLPLGSSVQSLAYGESKEISGVQVTLFPAGHILGSSQVRIVYRGETWVVSGDYKVEADRTCDQFEPVSCDVFITESTFGLPIFRWRKSEEIFAEINSWWAANAAQGFNSVIFGYALGKAQRVLSGLADGPVVIHSGLRNFQEIYTRQGVVLPGKSYEEVDSKSGLIVVCPPSIQGTSWLKKFEPYRTAFASGWMTLRGSRRRRNVDAGFTLSDHTDWDSLLSTIKATGASRVGVTHGYVQQVVRYLQEQGLDAYVVPTHFEGGISEEEEVQ